MRQAERTGDASAAAAFARVLLRLATQGTALPTPYSRIIDRRERLYELRFGDHRVAYFEHSRELVLLHGWRKRTQKLDAAELATARRRAADWRSRG